MTGAREEISRRLNLIKMESLILEPAATDGVITWIKMVNDEVIFDVEDWKIQRQVKSEIQK